MNINELMLGDFVKVHDKETEDDFIGKIYYLEAGYSEIGVSRCHHSVGYPYPIDCIEPVSLTPEILEKNGFERGVSSIVRTSTCAIPICESNTFCYNHEGKRLKDINIKDRGIWGWSVRSRVVCDTNWNEIHVIRYVHELQHALRLCGIEKEIEL